MNDPRILIGVSSNLGTTYIALKKYAEAELYCARALNKSKEVGKLDGLVNGYNNLSEIFEKTGRQKEALAAYKSYIAARDSMFNEENTKKTVQLEMQYEFDKKEAKAKAEAKAKQEIAAAESKRQKVIIWSICGILVLAIGFAIFAYRSYL